MRSWIRRLVRAVPLLLAVLVAAVLARELAANWDELQTFDWQLRPWPLVGSAALHLAMFAVVIETWRRIVTRVAVTVSRAEAARTYIYPHLSRYLPGGIWHYAGRALGLTRLGATRLATTYAITLEQILAVAAGATITAASLPFWQRSEIGDLKIVLLAAPVGLVLVHPRLAPAVVNPILKRLGRPPFRLEVSFSQMARLFAVTAFGSVLNALSSYALLIAIIPDARIGVGEFIGVVAVAQTAGFLAIGVPGGLGVREGALVVLLTGAVPSYAAVVFSIASRLWIVAFDLLAGGAMLVFDRYHRPRSEAAARDDA